MPELVGLAVVVVILSIVLLLLGDNVPLLVMVVTLGVGALVVVPFKLEEGANVPLITELEVGEADDVVKLPSSDDDTVGVNDG